MENWKKNLKALMGSHGIHPIEKWNDNLLTFGRAWANAVNETNGFYATANVRYENGNKVVQLMVKPTGYITTDFVCRMEYRIDEKGAVTLLMRAVNGFDYAGYIRNLAEEEKENFYRWSGDEISGIEIFEENYVLETVNIAFGHYLDFMRKGNAAE